jgi:pimeloyl-ACP methyl ester carboxylesterase
MRWKKISHFLVVAFFLSFWTFGLLPAYATCPLSDQEIEAVETLVQVGKYRLNFKVIEGGNLTILLEAGGGMDSSEWNKLAPELRRKTGATIVSYDRAGFGKSDLPETPHDMREEVEWLWQGLQKLKLDKDLIPVGHSFGGWMIRLFASEHREAVSGMVFVDPFTNEFVDQLGVEYLDNHPMAGKLPFDTSQPDKLTKLQRAMVRMVGDGLGSKMEIMRQTSVPSGIPVVVITCGRPFLPKTEEQKAWRLSHEQMTASIEEATLIVAEESDHMVPFRQPALIIEAVMKVIKSNFPVLKGPYLGQELPGMTPEVFAPGVLNTKKMGAFCSVFSPDGNEFYFVYYERENDASGGMAWMKRIDDVWTKPEMLHFNSTVTDNDMCMSSDGNKLIFRSWRALPDGKKPKDHSYLWFVERTEDGWSHAKPLYCGDVPVRTGYPSLAANGTLYFAHRNVEVFGIYRSKLINGAYSTPKHVFTAVDSIDTEGDMFVAPDESYMIISCWDHPGNIGSGQGDLYITFQKDDGTWTEEINMGELINTRYGENCPQVSPDGKYFFFNRYNPDAKEGNIYWVDAKIIEGLKPKESK